MTTSNLEQVRILIQSMTDEELQEMNRFAAMMTTNAPAKMTQEEVDAICNQPLSLDPPLQVIGLQCNDENCELAPHGFEDLTKEENRPELSNDKLRDLLGKERLTEFEKEMMNKAITATMKDDCVSFYGMLLEQLPGKRFDIPLPQPNKTFTVSFDMKPDMISMWVVDPE